MCATVCLSHNMDRISDQSVTVMTGQGAKRRPGEISRDVVFIYKQRVESQRINSTKPNTAAQE